MFALFVLLTNIAFSQVEKKANQFDGYIIKNDSTKIEGVIEINGSETYPWLNQNSVKYIPKEAFLNKKVKSKDKTKYDPKDLLEYCAGNREFETKKYANLLEGGAAVLPQRYFMERLVNGTISVYVYYESPPDVQVGTPEEIEAEYNRCRIKDILIQKGEEKLKNLAFVDIMEYISDCPEVKEKYVNGDYGIIPKNDGTKEGLGKVFASLGDDVQKIIVPLTTDYNKYMKSK